MNKSLLDIRLFLYVCDTIRKVYKKKNKKD